MKNKRLKIILLAVIILLLIPFIAMQFSNEVKWDIADFLIMGVLISAAGLFCELVFRKVKSVTYRIVICGIGLFVIFLVWAEIAVGIFRSPFAGS